MKYFLMVLITLISFKLMADTQRLEIVSRERSISKILGRDTIIVIDKKTKCEYIVTSPADKRTSPTVTLLQCPKNKKDDQ